MFAGLQILMIWKGKKVMVISHYRVQRIMLLVRVNVGLANLKTSQYQNQYSKK